MGIKVFVQRNWKCWAVEWGALSGPKHLTDTIISESHFLHMHLWTKDQGCFELDYLTFCISVNLFDLFKNILLE